MDIFVLSCKNSSFTQPTGILILIWISVKTFFTDSSFNVTKSQKLWGNEIRPELASAGSFPFSISNIWWENVSANRLFCNWTHIFWVKFNGFTWRQKVEYLRQACISFAGVERGITCNVCLKSPASNISAFPNGPTLPCKWKHLNCWIESKMFRQEKASILTCWNKEVQKTHKTETRIIYALTY